MEKIISVGILGSSTRYFGYHDSRSYRPDFYGEPYFQDKVLIIEIPKELEKSILLDDLILEMYKTIYKGTEVNCVDNKFFFTIKNGFDEKLKKIKYSELEKVYDEYNNLGSDFRYVCIQRKKEVEKEYEEWLKEYIKNNPIILEKEKEKNNTIKNLEAELEESVEKQRKLFGKIRMLK